MIRSLAAIAVCHLFAGSVLCAEAAADVLPQTGRLSIERPLDEVMVEGIDRFALRATAESDERRERHWNRDYSSHEAYEQSVSANRARLKTYIGAVDERVTQTGYEHRVRFGKNERLLPAKSLIVEPVRWQVLDGVTAAGLLLQPAGEIKQRVVALPDADWTPEQFCGLTEGLTPQQRIAFRLAQHGCEVLVPTLISRSDEYSGNPDVAYTNQPHREFVYRMAFQMGRHVIGYEVQKVLAAVDFFEAEADGSENVGKVGVVGVGEGGLVAMHATAIDPRIEACWVAGYFQKREGLWEEPIYRNVWRLLDEFGDAEIASLIAPRTLIVEACAAPEVDGPPRPRPGRRGGAAPGFIRTPKLSDVQTEFARARKHYEQLDAAEASVLVVSNEGKGPCGSDAALAEFLAAIGFRDPVQPPQEALLELAGLPDPDARQRRQFDELVEFTQKLYRRSARGRDRFWSNADRSSVEAWVKSAEEYRQYVWEEMIGKLPAPTMALNPRSRKVIDEPTHAGYEVVLDVYPDVIAAGILLLPKDLKEGERRPVVVCQHGLEGTPMDTITTDESLRAFRAYKGFSTQLVKRGFIVYAPQNPYRGKDRFRTLQRKSNPLGRSLFSYIIRQHERTLEWLSSLPWVDDERIGFYGLSYGGKTAVRVPPIVTQYALSICSADYNEWIRKNVSNVDRYSYMFTGEYEMFEWNMGHVANYAELATLMTPRPFMVERGHDDGVAPDEWVAWEYSKVRRHYDKLGIGDRTEIEWFDGPHTINGQATFAFLHRHLKWPERKEAGSER